MDKTSESSEKLKNRLFSIKIFAIYSLCIIIIAPFFWSDYPDSKTSAIDFYPATVIHESKTRSSKLETVEFQVKIEDKNKNTLLKWIEFPSDFHPPKEPKIGEKLLIAMDDFSRSGSIIQVNDSLGNLIIPLAVFHEVIRRKNREVTIYFICFSFLFFVCLIAGFYYHRKSIKNMGEI